MTRDRIVPFLRGGAWWARVPQLDRPAIQRSLGVYGKDNRDVAQRVCAFLVWARARRESFLLTAIADKKTTAGQAYTAYAENRLDRFLVELRDGLTDVDLEPYVAKWQRELTRRGKANAQTRTTYLRQVRTLLVEGAPFRRSQFTRQRIRDWLLELGVGQPNRYRAALSSFAEFLVFEDVLQANPVRQVPTTKEREPRTLYLAPLDALRVVEALPAPINALHALMLATGVEVSAARGVRRGDIDLVARTVFVRGTKRATRTRTCYVYDRWIHVWAVLECHIRASRGLPDFQPFAGISADHSLDELRKALARLQLPIEYRQHDHRHTWAVQAIRDGVNLHAIAAQLGHANASMVLKVYGRFAPTGADFRPSVTLPATLTNTTGVA